MQIRKLAPGDHLLDYRILEKIGEGGFGEVFRAEHQVLGRIVAIKVPRDLEALGALRLEGVIQATLDHPSIVKTLEISISHDPPYVVMEHVDGLSLAEMLKREGPLSWRRAARILVEAGRALKHAHERGVVHGDVKPHNVLCEPGDEGRVRLTDFGLGRVFEGPKGNVQISRSLELATSGAEVQGTLRYLAPEVQRGEPADERSDIYSWGVLLFEALTGKLPEGREVPSDLSRDCPWELDQVFETCFQRREKRPRSLDSAIAALDKLLVSGTRPRNQVIEEEARASRAIPYAQHDGATLVRPLTPANDAGQDHTAADALHVLRMLGTASAPGAVPAIPASAPIPRPVPTAAVPAVPAPDAPRRVNETHPPAEVDLGPVAARARADASFARWREAFVAAVQARFAERPAGTAVVPCEGFDLAVGVTTEGDPHHRIYATVLPTVDLETARRFVKAAKAVFEREKGVWEKEVTFALIVRDVQDKPNVLNALRGFSTGWWRRRRAVLVDLGAQKVYATELGCDPRGNPLKRLFFDAVNDASKVATASAAVAANACRARRECVKGGLVGIGLAIVATTGLIAGAVCVEKASQRCRKGRHRPTPAVARPAPAPVMRAHPTPQAEAPRPAKPAEAPIPEAEKVPVPEKAPAPVEKAPVEVEKPATPPPVETAPEKNDEKKPEPKSTGVF